MSKKMLVQALTNVALRDLGTFPLQQDELRVLKRLAKRARWKDGCLVFRGSDTDGYKRVWVNRTRWLVHRWLYLTFMGDPVGYDVDHRCHVRACGLHLRVLPPWENRGWRNAA